MKVLVFGSANIDRTYHVHHFVNAMETISASKMESFCGGKGFNQAIAFARAGASQSIPTLSEVEKMYNSELTGFSYSP